MAKPGRRDVLDMAKTKEGRAQLDELVKVALAREAGACVTVVDRLTRIEDFRIMWGGSPEPEVFAVRRAVYRSLMRGVRSGWAERHGRGFGTVYRKR